MPATHTALRPQIYDFMKKITNEDEKQQNKIYFGLPFCTNNQTLCPRFNDKLHSTTEYNTFQFLVICTKPGKAQIITRLR